MTKLFRAFSLLATVAVTSPAQAGLDIDPLSQVANPGDTITVDITASGLPANEVISYYGLLVGYDSTVLTATQVDFYDALNAGNALDSDQLVDLNVDPNALGYGTYSGMHSSAVDVSELSFVLDYFNDLKPFQTPEPFTLFTITFEVSLSAMDGTSVLELVDDSFFTNPPAFGQYDVKGETGSNVLNLPLNNGQVVVGGTAPVPGTALLMIVAGLVGVRWRASRATV